MKEDPTEQEDVQSKHPEKVEQLLNRLRQLRREQVEPIQGSPMGAYFKSRRVGEAIPKGYFLLSTASGKQIVSLDMWKYDELPEGSKLMLDGEPVQTSISFADAIAARKKWRANL